MREINEQILYIMRTAVVVVIWLKKCNSLFLNPNMYNSNKFIECLS